MFKITRDIITNRIDSIKGMNNYQIAIKNINVQDLATLERVEPKGNEDLNESIEKKRKMIEGLFKLVMK